jgi:D-3-phosphoglycerate dehydrogenase / 2-oxoglutarate reductase
VNKQRVALFSAVAREGREQLEDLAADFTLVERFELDRVEDADVLSDALDGVWATVAGGEAYSPAVLERTPALRVIARTGVGYDAIDVEAATRAGIAVTVTPDVNAAAVADFTLALMLACLRRVIQCDRCTRSGTWRSMGLGRDLQGATVGIVGLGTIGRGVAQRLSGFGCRILAVDPAPDLAFCNAAGIELVGLADALPELDVLTIHTPLIPATNGMIGADELALLPSHAIVVNAARGGVVVEDALVSALQNGSIAGAALDVFEHEPIRPEHPLLGLDNVVLSPHAAGFTQNAVARMLQSVMASLRDVAAGRVPAGCVNPEFASVGAGR